MQYAENAWFIKMPLKHYCSVCTNIRVPEKHHHQQLATSLSTQKCKINFNSGAQTEP